MTATGISLMHAGPNHAAFGTGIDHTARRAAAARVLCRMVHLLLVVAAAALASRPLTPPWPATYDMQSSTVLQPSNVNGASGTTTAVVISCLH